MDGEENLDLIFICGPIVCVEALIDTPVKTNKQKKKRGQGISRLKMCKFNINLLG